MRDGYHHIYSVRCDLLDAALACRQAAISCRVPWWKRALFRVTAWAATRQANKGGGDA